MQIVIVGTGYVGLVTGVCLAEVGHSVCCVDVDPAKVASLRRAEIPIFEPGLAEMVRRNQDHERLSFTTSLAEALRAADCIFIAVGTPQGEDGSADLKHVMGVAGDIGRLVERRILVVVKSTVPVGTCDAVEARISAELAKRHASFSIAVASNPEFLKEGSAIEDFMRPDRIVVGVNDASATERLREIYRPFVFDDPGKLYVMDRRSSELTKYGANAMLATRISFMNELACLCDRVGANIDHVRLGIGSDPRIGRKFLYAGPGYGGSCFPKDVAALVRSAEEHAIELRVLTAVRDANRAQRDYVAEKVRSYFAPRGGLRGQTIAVWGLAFKPGTDDVRESPALKLIADFLAAGARVVGHDPKAQANFAREMGAHPALTYADDAYAALAGADALVLVSEWPEYKRPNWVKAHALMRTPAVFDFRNQWEPQALVAMGFDYSCVGRPVAAASDAAT